MILKVSGMWSCFLNVFNVLVYFLMFHLMFYCDDLIYTYAAIPLIQN